MPDTILRWLVLLAWLFWLVFYWNGGLRLWEDIRQAASADSPRLDALLMVVMAMLTFVMMASGLLITLARISPVEWVGADVLLVIGAGLTFLGMGGTFYCRQYLGQFWTAEVALLPGHQVVEQGPYQLVRHPIYTSAIILYAGTALVFPVWWNGLAAGLVIVSYVTKASLEDKFLSGSLPGYRDYRRRVPYRLAPWVW